jgi:phosphopantetheinyl transferase (holo-ACP synthase)
LERLVKKMRFYLPANDIRKILLYDDPHKYATYAWTRKECLFKAHNRRNDIGYVNIANADDVVTLRDMKLVTKNIAENVVLTCYCPIGADIEWVSA